jgi:AcrR family transcriptional regulator
MPRSSEQFDDIRKQKKKLIMDTALELFAENGFHATSISQIAKKAQISKGLTYNYFESKKEILDEIIKKGFDSIYSNFDLNHDGVLSKEEFIHFIKTSFNEMRTNPKFWKLYFSLMFQPKVTESFQHDYSESSKKIYTIFLQFLKNMGSKQPESDILSISSMLKGAYITGITAPEFFPPEKLDNIILDACFKIINNQNSKATEHED